ncbi:hypothetical protein JHK85_010576 [Glycine max]|nr:hypothetical protein JHK85_010576 [Glycine max]
MNKPMHIHHFSVSISCIHLLLKRSFAAYLQQAHKLIVGEICVALFRRLNFIAEINDDKETWKIDVRLINMWIIPRLPRFNIKQIFIDKEVRLLDLFNMVYPLVVVSFFLKHVYKI